MVDFADSPEQATFRAEVTQFIDENLPDVLKIRDNEQGYFQAPPKGDRGKALKEWREKLIEKGWIAPAWPKEIGGVELQGGDLTPMEQYIMNETFAEVRAPRLGVPDVGSTIMVHGSEEQKQEFLPPMVRGESRWCQGYSEPGSGSDLASLQTRAVRDGDDFVINGQKIWTSGAHRADWLYALVRTDPNAPKHRGISFLMLDKNTPGITIRPLIDMSWRHHFNEVFFEDVRVPATNLVGEENRGWYVGMTLLDFERSNITGAITSRRSIRSLLEYLETDEGAAKANVTPSVRTAIADRYIETEVMFNFSFRIISMQNANQIPNYEASTSKLFNSELSQALARTGSRAFGLYAGLWEDADGRAPMGGRFTKSYVQTVPATIAAGTSEVQRNIIATRGLGLPRG